MSYVLGLSFINLLFQEYDDQGRVIKKKKKGGKVWALLHLIKEPEIMH